jgi:hypothetical protein
MTSWSAMVDVPIDWSAPFRARCKRTRSPQFAGGGLVIGAWWPLSWDVESVGAVIVVLGALPSLFEVTDPVSGIVVMVGSTALMGRFPSRLVRDMVPTDLRDWLDVADASLVPRRAFFSAYRRASTSARFLTIRLYCSSSGSGAPSMAIASSR